jgi:tagatose-1,6-bisphosphate aldolase
MTRAISAGKRKGMEAVADMLRVGLPINMAFVAGSPAAGNEILYSRQETIEHHQAAENANVPFIYLSQGVGNEAFQYALELAAEAGVNFCGVLSIAKPWFAERQASHADKP